MSQNLCVEWLGTLRQELDNLRTEQDKSLSSSVFHERQKNNIYCSNSIIFSLVFFDMKNVEYDQFLIISIFSTFKRFYNEENCRDEFLLLMSLIKDIKLTKNLHFCLITWIEAATTYCQDKLETVNFLMILK